MTALLRRRILEDPECYPCWSAVSILSLQFSAPQFTPRAGCNERCCINPPITPEKEKTRPNGPRRWQPKKRQLVSKRPALVASRSSHRLQTRQSSPTTSRVATRPRGRHELRILPRREQALRGAGTVRQRSCPPRHPVARQAVNELLPCDHVHVSRAVLLALAMTKAQHAKTACKSRDYQQHANTVQKLPTKS